MSDKLTGLIAASHTPMHSDGSINLEQIENQVRFYQANPINGAFICGTTGEGKLLTLNERKQVAESWVKNSGGKIPVIVHVGCDCMDDSKILARHAEEIGAYAIAVTAPSFYRPASVKELVNYCREIAESVPELPFYFYHIPALTYVSFPMIEFLKQASPKIPTLAGLKYTHNDFVDLAACHQFDNGRFNILFGRDEMLIAALAYGIENAVGSTYNYAAPLNQELIKSFCTGDLEKTRYLQKLSVELINLVTQYNEIAVGKTIMSLLGIDCGPVRSPLKNLDPEERKIIENAFMDEKYQAYLCRSEYSPA